MNVANISAIGSAFCTCWQMVLFLWRAPVGFDKQFFERKIVNIFLPISINICLGCSKEPSHRDGSFNWPQRMFGLRNKEIIFWYAFLTNSLN